MRTSRTGIEFIKHWEGVSLKPYRDVAGYWTVGVGHLLREGEPVEQITMEQADEYLIRDLSDAERCVNSQVGTELTQNEFDALVSFVFNLGCGNFRRSSLLRLLNRGDFGLAASEFERWNRAGGKVVRGLTRRRKAEREMFEGI